MSIRPDAPAILSDGQEVKVHGSEAFPFAVYRGIMPTFIPAYPLHYHEEMELICCEAGCGIITIDRKTVPLQPGEVAVILPGQIHAIDVQLLQYPVSLFAAGAAGQRDLPPFFGTAGRRQHGSARPHTKRQPPGQGTVGKRMDAD